MSNAAIPPVKKNDERLQLLIDAVRDYSIYMLDPHGLVTTWHSGTSRNNGYTADEIIGHHFRSAFLPEDIERGEPERLLGIATQCGQVECEGWRVNKDGSPFWASTVLSAIRSEAGELIGFAKIIRDLTDRKQRDDELRASEQRFRNAMQYSAVGMALVGLDGRWLQVNRAVCDLFGYEADALTRMTFQQITYPDDLEADLHFLADLLAGKIQSYRMEKRYIRKDGSTIWGMLAVSLVRNADGTPQHFISQIQDINHLKKVEAELHEQRDRLHVTLYSIGDGVITTDADGRVEFMNPVAELMTGWNLEEVRGQPHERIFQIVHAETGQPIESPVHACLIGERTFYLHDRSVLVRRDGECCDIQDSAAPIRAENGRVIGVILVFQDITDVRRMQRELEYSALHDALTGLPNRRMFETALAEALRASRDEGLEHALCFLDLDRFKIVNDTAGHAAGDMLLRMITQVLCQAVRQDDLVARLGGDEFAIILFDNPIDKSKQILAHALERIAALQFPWEGRIYNITASIGLTRILPISDSISTMMKEADVACYAAKRAGRSQLSVYAKDLSNVSKQHHEFMMVAELHGALTENRFRLHLQRIVATGTDTAQRYEVLVRMIDREGELISPDHFIEAAERHGLMPDIDRWVLQEVLTHRARALAAIPELKLSINLSAESLNDQKFLAYFLDQVERSPLRASSLTLEITETAMMNNLLTASAIVDKIRSLGCRIALDDFGIGLSSFSYLRTFQVDYLKIDGSFIRNMANNPVDLAIVKSINNIAHEIGAQTVAEFVEDDATLQRVREIGIDFAQGYGIAEPIDLDVLMRAYRTMPTRTIEPSRFG
jgi:diguanylate cyclase (GGDEF)-like protein/PAS domain S-box-containing protein